MSPAVNIVLDFDCIMFQNIADSRQYVPVPSLSLLFER